MTDRDFNIDDGNWFPIMHEMADKLMTYRLSGTEHQVIYMLMRHCYGYQNSTCDLSWKDMKDFTNLQDGSLSKAISKLKKRNILHTFQKESKTNITYKINSKISTWKTLSKRKDFPKGKQTLSKRKVTPIIKNNKNIYSEALSKRKVKLPYQEIISYLNNQAGKNFKFSNNGTKKLIKARWNEGFRLEDFKKVIDTKCVAWKTDAKMAIYLRPQTLFGTRFESYLNEKPVQPEIEKDTFYKELP